VFDKMNISGSKTHAETFTEDETSRSEAYKQFYTNRVTHQHEEAVRVQQELIIRESLMYEQLERAAAAAAQATATATSFKRGLPGGIHAAPFPYHGAPHLPPWMTGASPAAYTVMPPTSALPVSASFHPGSIARLQDIAVGAQVESPKGGKVKRWINGQNSFPVELFRLLSHAKADGNEHVVSFTPSGRAFHVHKRDEFIRDVAPPYFSPKHFSSFMRQLNKYDFGKVVTGSEKGAFFHPYLQRGNIELCRKIRVKKEEDDSKKRYWSKQKACLFFQSNSVCDP
jgi:hypothetical protein